MYAHDRREYKAGTKVKCRMCKAEFEVKSKKQYKCPKCGCWSDMMGGWEVLQ